MNNNQLKNPARMYRAPYAKFATPLIPKVRLNPRATKANIILLTKPYIKVPSNTDKLRNCEL